MGTSPQTPYRGYAPGTHYGTSVPKAIFCEVQEILKLCCKIQ